VLAEHVLVLSILFSIFTPIKIAATLISSTFERNALNLFKMFEDKKYKSKFPAAALINFYELG
jgi:hypothetical protein